MCHHHFIQSIMGTILITILHVNLSKKWFYLFIENLGDIVEEEEERMEEPPEDREKINEAERRAEKCYLRVMITKPTCRISQDQLFFLHWVYTRLGLSTGSHRW